MTDFDVKLDVNSMDAYDLANALIVQQLHINELYGADKSSFAGGLEQLDMVERIMDYERPEQLIVALLEAHTNVIAVLAERGGRNPSELYQRVLIAKESKAVSPDQVAQEIATDLYGEPEES